MSSSDITKSVFVAGRVSDKLFKCLHNNTIASISFFDNC